MQHDFSHGGIARTLVQNASRVHANDVTSSLVGYAKRRGEVQTTPHGAIVASTGKFTGRSAKDKYIVRDPLTENSVWWDNAAEMTPAAFDLLLEDMLAHAEDEELFRQQLFAGADPKLRYSVEVFSESAWHALFIRHLFIRPDDRGLQSFDGNVTIVHMPSFFADPARHGTKSETVIALDFTRNIVLIGGTGYAGEVKKSVFSLFNFHAPEEDIFPMHCSANVGPEGDTTIYFGLSGTGKTTLSATAERALIGDDEHGWSKDGVFNLEGGCYAKAINLSKENEPEIYNTTLQFGTVLENVTFDPVTGEVDFHDGQVTENTRIAYPLTAIHNRVDSGRGGVPKNVVLLSADAFGVLPPIARLSGEQAIYYFLSGYTAKVAGTERGVTEPQATFSACFGAPFMARHPSAYGALLAKRLAESGAQCWLLNTGWTGGGYGVGHRMALKDTRRMLNAALKGELDDGEFVTDPVFGLAVPKAIEGVDSLVLDPEKAWGDTEAYRAAAQKLVNMFEANFESLGPKAKAILDDVPQSSHAA